MSCRRLFERRQNNSSSGVGIIRSFRSRPAFSFAHTANLQEPGSSVTTQASSVVSRKTGAGACGTQVAGTQARMLMFHQTLMGNNKAEQFSRKYREKD